MKTIPEGYVNFGDVSRGRLDMQSQYGVRYVEECGEGLRFIGDAADYHSLLIHVDDVEEFVRRARTTRYRAAFRGYFGAGS